VVLNELNSGVKVRRVELVGYVPAERSEFPPLLHDRVQEGHRVQHRLPLRQVGHLEEVGVHRLKGALETCSYALRRLGRVLDGRLKQADGKLDVRLGGDPDAARLVHVLGGDERFEHLLAELERQVAILQQNPTTTGNRCAKEATSVDLLALTHADGLDEGLKV